MGLKKTYSVEIIKRARFNRMGKIYFLTAATAAEVANSGDYFTAQLFDDPLIVVRGDDAHIRVLANVCRHR